MRVRDIMTPDPRTARPEDDVTTIATMMRDEDVGAIPIVDGSGQLRGIITDRDITTKVVAAGKNPEEVTVADCMTPNPTTILPDADVRAAAALMGAEQIRRLPVVENGRLIAMLSIGDLAVEQDEDADIAVEVALEEISEPAH